MIGRTVALTQCPAYQYGRDMKISGLYRVVDFTSDNYGQGFILCRDDLDPEVELDNTNSYDVEPSVLWEQVDPKGWGASLVADREHEFHMEDHDREMQDV